MLPAFTSHVKMLLLCEHTASMQAKRAIGTSHFDSWLRLGSLMGPYGVQVADYGLVMDLFEAIPSLGKEIQKHAKWNARWSLCWCAPWRNGACQSILQLQGLTALVSSGLEVRLSHVNTDGQIIEHTWATLALTCWIQSTLWKHPEFDSLEAFRKSKKEIFKLLEEFMHRLVEWMPCTCSMYVQIAIISLSNFLDPNDSLQWQNALIMFIMRVVAYTEVVCIAAHSSCQLTIFMRQSNLTPQHQEVNKWQSHAFYNPIPTAISHSWLFHNSYDCLCPAMRCPELLRDMPSAYTPSRKEEHCDAYIWSWFNNSTAKQHQIRHNLQPEQHNRSLSAPIQVMLFKPIPLLRQSCFCQEGCTESAAALGASAVMWAADLRLLSNVIILIRQGRIGGILQLLLILRLLHCVDDHLRRLQRHLFHKVQVRVPAPTPGHSVPPEQWISSILALIVPNPGLKSYALAAHLDWQIQQLCPQRGKIAWEGEGIPDKLACQIEEGLLVVVVALCWDLVVLQVLLPAKKPPKVRIISSISQSINTAMPRVALGLSE
jgi:hypothetical protein